jgi:recombination protein RecA
MVKDQTDEVGNWRESVKKAFGDKVSFGASTPGRLSTGIYALDRATGGGWATGKFHLIVGYESTGKSTIVLKSAAEANKINWDTGELDLSYSNPMPVLICDQEFSMDSVWAEKHGFDIERPGNEIVGLSDGHAMVDVVNNALLSGEFGLIIIDSLESTASLKVLEQSASDSYMGDRARILNDGYRRWTSTRISIESKLKDTPWKIPTLIAINQLREKIGVMYGDPNVIPGGKAQLMYSSTILRMSPAKVESDAEKSYGMATFKGITQKNKTAPPKRNFTFEMAIIDTDKLRQGEVDNAGSVFKDARDSGLLFKDDSGWKFGDESFRVQGDFKDKLYNDPAYLAGVWKKVAEVMKNAKTE